MKKIIIGITTLVCIVLVLALYFVFRPQKDNERTEQINEELLDVKKYGIYDINSDDNCALYGVKEEDLDGTPLKYVKLLDMDKDSYIYNVSTYSNKLYISYIDNKKLIVKRVSLTNPNYTLEDYLKIDMPSDYELCGLYEASERYDNYCEVNMLPSRTHLYFSTISSEFKDAIYVYDISNRKISLINETKNDASLKMVAGPHLMLYNNHLIFANNDGLFISDYQGNNVQSIYKLSDELDNMFLLYDDSSDNVLSRYVIYNDKLYYNVATLEVTTPHIGEVYSYDFKTGKSTKVANGLIVYVKDNKLGIVDRGMIYIVDKDNITNITISNYNSNDTVTVGYDKYYSWTPNYADDEKIYFERYINTMDEYITSGYIDISDINNYPKEIEVIEEP